MAPRAIVVGSGTALGVTGGDVVQWVVFVVTLVQVGGATGGTTLDVTLAEVGGTVATPAPPTPMGG
jgi:hypothetical protein